jgi:phosphoglycerol transferase MdoB-like AlkP superfamily enzyme
VSRASAKVRTISIDPAQPTSSSSHEHRAAGWFHSAWQSSVFYVVPWAIVAATDVFLKTRVLKNGGLDKAATAIGRSHESFTFFERIAFLRGDLLVSCLLIPIIILGLAHFLPVRLRRLGMWCLALLAFFAELVLFLQYGMFLSVGRFANFEIIWEGLKWWYAHPESATGTPAKRLVIELVIAGLLVSVFTEMASYLARKPESRTAIWVRRTILSAGVGVILGAAVAWAPMAHGYMFDEDLLSTVVRASFTDSVTMDPAILKLSVPELRQMYRQTARMPVDSQLPEYFGKARGYNVVMLVLETAPTSILDPAVNDLHDMPNLRRLREHAFVAARHYSTFPATNRATFSILTSIYMSVDFGWSAGEVSVPSMIRSLDKSGYQTAFYGYSWEGGGDLTMLRDIGFQRLVNSELESTAFLPDMELGLPWEERVKRDAAPLHGLENDIRTWALQGQKFAVQFSPELGHGPWPVIGDKPDASMDERGHALVVFQDAWLGEIMSLLEGAGLLDKTIIVVTADHGIRFKAEHPDFPLGKIDDMSFHVPLLVYVPGILKSTKRIDWPTSHIDIQPTVLDLLGVQVGREWEEGSPIWEPALDHRRVFMLADMMFGADGYWDDGKYYMEQNDSGAVFESGTDHFQSNNILPPESSEAAEVRSTLTHMISVEHAVRMHLEGGVLRGSSNA